MNQCRLVRPPVIWDYLVQLGCNSWGKILLNALFVGWFLVL
jgi:hypothetical protein